jgi:anti-sigma B factor antagonist
MDFACGTFPGSDGPTVVWAVGEVDMAVAKRLGAEIDSRLVPGSTVALDCTGITFMDSSGLRVLVRALRLAEEVRAEFVLTSVPQPVAKVLTLAGLAGLFRCFADVAEVTAQAAR